MRKIVVGVDGSEPSRRALAWAIDEARVHGGEIVAVHAWSVPVAAGVIPAPGLLMAPPSAEFVEDATALLNDVIRDVTGRHERVVIRREVRQGSATYALLAAAADADMLVIGSRGLGGFGGLLLGSVGHQCAHRAHCPVVIIPHDERASAREAS